MSARGPAVRGGADKVRGPAGRSPSSFVSDEFLSSPTVIPSAAHGCLTSGLLRCAPQEAVIFFPLVHFVASQITPFATSSAAKSKMAGTASTA